MADFAPVAHKTWLTGRVSISGTTPTAMRVESTNLSERKWLMIQNSSESSIFIGSETAQGTDVTAYTLPKYGIKVAKGDILWLPVSDAITIYAMVQKISGANSGLARIAEIA